MVKRDGQWFIFLLFILSFFYNEDFFLRCEKIYFFPDTEVSGHRKCPSIYSRLFSAVVLSLLGAQLIIVLGKA